VVLPADIERQVFCPDRCQNAGIDPAPRRTGPAWSLFLRSQAEAILACDFFTADLLDGTQAYVLAVIEHASRRIRILGVTLHPTGEWTAQQARNLIMDLGEQAHRVKFMIRDRGSDFTAAFDAVLADAGIRTVLCNVQTPRMNAIAERWIGGCRRELLDRTLVWNQAHLRRILREYETHHNQHRRTGRWTPLRRSNRCPNRSILSSTVSEGTLASVADQRIPAGRMTWTRFSAPTLQRKTESTAVGHGAFRLNATVPGSGARGCDKAPPGNVTHVGCGYPRAALLRSTWNSSPAPAVTAGSSPAAWGSSWPA
jgi:hypothetical protein